MRIIRLGKWRFTEEELTWLADQATTNHIAADILVRFNLHYGRREKLLQHLTVRLRQK